MASCKSISNHMWARTCCGNPDAMKILFTSSPTKWKKNRLNKLHNLYDLVYNSVVCVNNPITPTVQLRGRWPTYTHKLHTFFAFRSRKSVYQRASLIQCIQLALFCIVLENKSFLFQNGTAKVSNQHFHISTTESL